MQSSQDGRQAAGDRSERPIEPIAQFREEERLLPSQAVSSLEESELTLLQSVHSPEQPPRQAQELDRVETLAGILQGTVGI